MKKKSNKSFIDYDGIIENSFYSNLIKSVLMEFGKIKESYNIEILIDLTDKKIKIPKNCRKNYNQDEVMIEINSTKSKLEFKKDRFTTYITNNESEEIYKIEVPYSAVLCLIDKETKYTIDCSIIDDIKDSMEESEDIKKYEYDPDDEDIGDDNRFINAIINITSRCIAGDMFTSDRKKRHLRNLNKVRSGEQENKIIYFKNLLTTDRD